MEMCSQVLLPDAVTVEVEFGVHSMILSYTDARQHDM